MPEIRLLVDRQGKLHLDMVGYPGESCVPVLERLLKALAEHGIRPEVERLLSAGEAPRVEDRERVVE